MKVFSCVAHDAVFGLLEEKSDAECTEYKLYRNTFYVGLCEFPSHLSPRFSISNGGGFAVYGGCNAYLYTQSETLSSIKEEEEVSRIWFLDDIILVKTETRILERTLSDFEINREYLHNEIITSAFLTKDGSLMFQDLENHSFQLNLRDFSVVTSDVLFGPFA